MSKTFETEALKHGSVGAVIKAFDAGAGVFFRSDVELLIQAARTEVAKLTFLLDRTNTDEGMYTFPNGDIHDAGRVLRDD